MTLRVCPKPGLSVTGKRRDRFLEQLEDHFVMAN
jgi:hypothetical protein